MNQNNKWQNRPPEGARLERTERKTNSNDTDLPNCLGSKCERMIPDINSPSQHINCHTIMDLANEISKLQELKGSMTSMKAVDMMEHCYF